MGLSTAGRAAMHAGLAAVAGYASLHSADPGTAGVNELPNTGSPAYARKAITWGTPGDVLDSSNAPVFDIPPGGAPTHFGLWSAATGGTYYGSGALSSLETYVQQGKYTLTNADSLLTT